MGTRPAGGEIQFANFPGRSLSRIPPPDPAIVNTGPSLPSVLLQVIGVMDYVRRKFLDTLFDDVEPEPIQRRRLVIRDP